MSKETYQAPDGSWPEKIATRGRGEDGRSGRIEMGQHHAYASRNTNAGGLCMSPSIGVCDGRLAGPATLGS